MCIHAKGVVANRSDSIRRTAAREAVEPNSGNQPMSAREHAALYAACACTQGQSSGLVVQPSTIAARSRPDRQTRNQHHNEAVW